MTIELVDAPDSKMKDTFLNEFKGQCGEVCYTRKITREPNEEGKWKRLLNEIEELAFKYGVEFDKALDIFKDVACCKKAFKEALESGEHVIWTEFDDQTLKNVDSPEYRQLVKSKGLDEINRRRKFLGLDKESPEEDD